MEAIVMATDGNWKIINENKITLDMLQASVHGCIEAVFLDDDIVMYCNEDGINLELPINWFATLYGQYQKRVIGCILGDVVFTKSNNNGDTIGLSQDEINNLIDCIEIYQNRPE